MTEEVRNGRSGMVLRLRPGVAALACLALMACASGDTRGDFRGFDSCTNNDRGPAFCGARERAKT